jgi:hypothetical protein
MAVMGVVKFERFFRVAAGLDVDKADLKRFNEFVNKKLYDLLVRGEAVAKANGRDIIQPHDLPITKGLQESINDFKGIDEEIELQPILDELTRRPPLDLDYAVETEARFAGIVGGIGVALARSFEIIEPDLKNPMTEHWERSYRIFDLLL